MPCILAASYTLGSGKSDRNITTHIDEADEQLETLHQNDLQYHSDNEEDQETVNLMDSFSQLDINGFKPFDSVTPIEHDQIEEHFLKHIQGCQPLRYLSLHMDHASRIPFPKILALSNTIHLIYFACICLQALVKMMT